jgi:hypothetical protein
MRPVEREHLLDVLPASTLRYLAREFGVNTTPTRNRAQLQTALALAPAFSTEIMLTLLQGDDLQRVARVAGVPAGGLTRRQLKARLVGLKPRPGEGAPGRLDVPKAVGYLLDMSPVGGICRAYQGNAAHRLFVGGDIPGRLLAQAAPHLRIPEYEHIIALYDNSLLGSCAHGFALGEHGIYWRNPYGLASARTALSWHEFAKAPLERVGNFELRLGDEAALHMTFIEQDDLHALLKELQHYALSAMHRRGMALICPDMKAAARRCRRLNPMSFNAFSMGARFPEDLRRQTLLHFRMPDFERIAVVCDDTVLGSGQRGFVLGMHGLYWRNGISNAFGRGALSWSEFACAHIEAVDEDSIRIGDDAQLHLEFLDATQAVELFSEIQTLTRSAADDIARNTFFGDEEARDLRRELNRELRDPEAMPIAVARANHATPLQHARAYALRLTSGAVQSAFTTAGRSGSGLLRKAKLRR